MYNNSLERFLTKQNEDGYPTNFIYQKVQALCDSAVAVAKEYGTVLEADSLYSGFTSQNPEESFSVLRLNALLNNIEGSEYVAYEIISGAYEQITDYYARNLSPLPPTDYFHVLGISFTSWNMIEDLAILMADFFKCDPPLSVERIHAIHLEQSKDELKSLGVVDFESLKHAIRKEFKRRFDTDDFTIMDDIRSRTNCLAYNAYMVAAELVRVGFFAPSQLPATPFMIADKPSCNGDCSNCLYQSDDPE